MSRTAERPREWVARRVVAGPSAWRDGLGVDIYELEADVPGPVVTVLAGVHGDEPAGVLAAGRLATMSLALRQGTLRVVPVCNEAAFSASTRTGGDGLDLARVFPGATDGQATKRLAHLITESALSDSDCLVDLHTAGRVADMPFLVGYVDDGSPTAAASRAAALAFGAPLVWRHPEYSAGRSLKTAARLGAAGIYVESGGGTAVKAGVVAAYVSGVLRVLGSLDMIDPPEGPPPPQPTEVSGSGDLDSNVIRAGASGFFVRASEPGELVACGHTLGEVWDLHGLPLEVVTATSAGRLMYLRRRSAVSAGDALATIAELD